VHMVTLRAYCQNIIVPAIFSRNIITLELLSIENLPVALSSDPFSVGHSR
jgi:hypothetical protein